MRRVFPTHESGDKETRQIMRSIAAPKRRPPANQIRSAMRVATMASAKIGHTGVPASVATPAATMTRENEGSGRPPWSSSTPTKTICKP
jgi:hypothetical protein